MTIGLEPAWTHATINRHFVFHRHVLMLAVKNGLVSVKESGTVTKTVATRGRRQRRTPMVINSLVRPEGLEPPTLGSEVRCSIQLSYGRFTDFHWLVSILDLRLVGKY